MWSLDDIRIEIGEAEGEVWIVEITTPAGRVELIGAFSVDGRVLRGREVHIQGLGPGDLGRAGLNAIGRKLLVEADVDKVVIERGTRTTGARKSARPHPITFPHEPVAAHGGFDRPPG